MTGLNPLTVAEARILVDRLREEGESVRRIAGGWITRCPCCDEPDALFIGDPGTPDPDAVPS